jgi:LPS sulfotransferase NodH
MTVDIYTIVTSSGSRYRLERHKKEESDEWFILFHNERCAVGGLYDRAKQTFVPADAVRDGIKQYRGYQVRFAQAASLSAEEKADKQFWTSLFAGRTSEIADIIESS